MRSVAIVLSGDRREGEAPGKDMVRAAKVRVKRDSEFQKPRAKRRKRSVDTRLPAEPWRVEEGYQEIPFSHHRRKFVTCRVQIFQKLLPFIIKIKMSNDGSRATLLLSR